MYNPHTSHSLLYLINDSRNLHKDLIISQTGIVHSTDGYLKVSYCELGGKELKKMQILIHISALE